MLSAERVELFIRSAAALYDACPNNLNLNGERWLLERTMPLGFTVLFDVGANVGDWALCAARCHPQADIHAFEIVPATFEEFVRNVADRPKVIANAFGLSDADDSVDVFLSDSSLISSVYDFTPEITKTKIACRVERGATYAQRRGISQIDLVKIDVEGAEGAVLKGLAPLIDEQAVRAVQFEYNMGAIESHFLLLDFYQFFQPRGYVLGRLTPKGVIFRQYRHTFEDFNGPNYVACRASDRELIELISI